MPIWKQHISKRGFPLREVILQMYGIAIWWTEAHVDGSLFHVWSFHGLRPWALILNDWEAALRRLRVDVWWWGSSSSCGRENLKFRDTFHASLENDQPIQLFRKRIGNCFLYLIASNRGEWSFLIKGVSENYQQNAAGTPFIETPCICTFLHFPCTHASKERCKKHSGYLGCKLLRPLSFLIGFWGFTW